MYDNIKDMDFNFKNITQFNEYFKDEKTCYEYLEQHRWGKDIYCPHCGSTKKPYNVKPRGKFKDIPSYRCSEKECGLPFTVRTGSIFQGSKVELKKWFQAAYELSISKKGISSVELGERIGVSQKTAWFINHRLREMLKNTAPELLGGMVEADESYFGGRESNKHKHKRVTKTKGRGMASKKPVFGLLERGGNVEAVVVPNTKGDTLVPIIRDRVKSDALVVTDEFAAYNRLNETHRHEIVRHSAGQYKNGIAHTNSLEGFWSLLKRGVVGTFHLVSPQHLQKYCDEFAYRYNNRNEKVDDRFNDTLKRFHTARLTYDQLTKRKNAI